MLTMKDFVPENNPILRKEAEEVQFPLSQEDQSLIKAMREFLKNSQDEELAEKYDLRAGVGLAAPQIGVSKQIFAVYVMGYDEEGYETEPELDLVFINPKLKRHSVKQVAIKEGEGCLSVPREVPGFVPRPKKVTLQYQDIDGQTHELKLQDFHAIVVQHELDHLKGIMFYDHIDAENPWNSKNLELL